MVFINNFDMSIKLEVEKNLYILLELNVILIKILSGFLFNSYVSNVFNFTIYGSF